MVAATPNASTRIGSRFTPVLYRSNAAMIPLTVAMYEFEVILSRPISGNLVYPARQVYLPITTYPGGGPEAPLGGVPEGTTSKQAWIVNLLQLIIFRGYL